MPAGSGAIVVHKQLEAALQNYTVEPYSPMFEWVPPLLLSKRRRYADLVHTAADHAWFVSANSTPLVVTFHNYVLDAFMRPYSSALQRLHYKTDLRWWIGCALNRALTVTAVSLFTAKLVTHDFGFSGPIRVIPNGIDTSRFRPGGERKRRFLRVLFSGNLTTRKGAQWLQEIAERLDPGIRVVCAAGLRKRKVGRTMPNVELLGHVPWSDMPNLYRSVDMLLMPTVREGMSLTVLEAMACGLPVVATDCSSLPELIHSERGGFLCPLGDIGAFATSVNKLARDQLLRRTMGEYNRARVEEEYTIELLVARYRSLFEETLDTE